MKCTHCSKVIPDGFTDCPWCGASALPGPSPSASGSSPRGELFSSSGLVVAISAVISGVLFLALSYVATSWSAGPLSADNWDAFLGRGLGALALACLAVFGYRKIRKAKLRGPLLALIVLTLSSLFTVLTFALPARPRLRAIDPKTVRRYADTELPRKTPNTPARPESKWDAPARQLMQDVQARNQQYVAEISSLDEAGAKPLYSIDSFHDAAAIQQIIDQLRTRIAVADKYADWQPLFSKMKDYVGAVDAGDEEKRKFLTNYEATLPQTLAVCKVISDREHAWLRASIDLYQFALAKEGAFDWRRDQLAFRNRADSETFRKKFLKARALNEDFLKAYWQVRQAQEAMMAQLGLPPSAGDPPPAP